MSTHTTARFDDDGALYHDAARRELRQVVEHLRGYDVHAAVLHDDPVSTVIHFADVVEKKITTVVMSGGVYAVTVAPIQHSHAIFTHGPGDPRFIVTSTAYDNVGPVYDLAEAVIDRVVALQNESVAPVVPDDVYAGLIAAEQSFLDDLNGYN